jgi:hypothetical protein
MEELNIPISFLSRDVVWNAYKAIGLFCADTPRAEEENTLSDVAYWITLAFFHTFGPKVRFYTNPKTGRLAFNGYEMPPEHFEGKTVEEIHNNFLGKGDPLVANKLNREAILYRMFRVDMIDARKVLEFYRLPIADRQCKITLALLDFEGIFARCHEMDKYHWCLDSRFIMHVVNQYRKKLGIIQSITSAIKEEKKDTEEGGCLHTNPSPLVDADKGKEKDVIMKEEPADGTPIADINELWKEAKKSYRKDTGNMESAFTGEVLRTFRDRGYSARFRGLAKEAGLTKEQINLALAGLLIRDSFSESEEPKCERKLPELPKDVDVPITPADDEGGESVGSFRLHRMSSEEYETFKAMPEKGEMPKTIKVPTWKEIFEITPKAEPFTIAVNQGVVRLNTELPYINVYIDACAYSNMEVVDLVSEFLKDPPVDANPPRRITLFFSNKASDSYSFWDSIINTPDLTGWMVDQWEKEEPTMEDEKEFKLNARCRVILKTFPHVAYAKKTKGAFGMAMRCHIAHENPPYLIPSKPSGPRTKVMLFAISPMFEFVEDGNYYDEHLREIYHDVLWMRGPMTNPEDRVDPTFYGLKLLGEPAEALKWKSAHWHKYV